MSHCSDLPPEILDLVIDFLYDEPETLRQCCLVSKSWVPRTRKHLFAVIEFHTKDKIEAWRKAFPDPSDSPARYTQSLKITCPRAITEADGIEGGWITTFSRLEHLQVKGSWTGASHLSSGLDLALFRNMPPTLKSLFVTSFPFPFLQFFNLIGSLPLLEDLSLVGDAPYINDDDPDQAHTAAPSSSPPFTGMLDLRLYRGIAGAANRLLNMPNGLRFRGLQLQWYRWEHLRYVVRLVAACSDTLELLDVTCMARDKPVLNRIDVSKATKLQGIQFWPGSVDSGWIIATLETITSKHRDFRKIYIDVDHVRELDKANPEVAWSDLDRLLVKFWESRSIRTRLGLTEPPKRAGGMRGLAMFLLPELTKRGMIDFVEEPVSDL